MRARYQYELQGTNLRMTDVQAAIAIPQLARLRDTTEQRQANAARLSEGIAGIAGLEPPVTAAGREHVFHQYTVRVTDEAPLDRDAVAAALADRGVQTGIYYPRVVFDYDSYRGHPLVVQADVPHARDAARQVLSLPVHPHLSDADLDRIVDAVRVAFGA
jgi:dTDP-4-amino-4,6-dideoxygalactose transaminase